VLVYLGLDEIVLEGGGSSNAQAEGGPATFGGFGGCFFGIIVIVGENIGVCG